MADMKEPLVGNWEMQSMVTVNEARKDRGLGPLTLANGKPDPDGLLKVEQYRRKLREKEEYAVQATNTAQPPTPTQRTPFKNLK